MSYKSYYQAEQAGLMTKTRVVSDTDVGISGCGNVSDFLSKSRGGMLKSTRGFCFQFVMDVISLLVKKYGKVLTA